MRRTKQINVRVNNAVALFYGLSILESFRYLLRLEFRKLTDMKVQRDRFVRSYHNPFATKGKIELSKSLVPYGRYLVKYINGYYECESGTDGLINSVTFEQRKAKRFTKKEAKAIVEKWKLSGSPRLIRLMVKP